MLTRVLARSLGGFGVGLAVASITVTLTYVVPGDPARTMAGPQADAATVARIHAQLGLDDPVWWRFGRYVWNALQGDLGRSFLTDQPVLPAILERLPATALLALGAVVVYVALGGALGVLGAVRAGSSADRLGSGLALAGLSVPSFWIGLVLLYLFAYRFPLFPLGGAETLSHLVLPALTLGIAGAATYTRVLRQTLGEELHKDYIRAARARGLSEPRVVLEHGLRNAALPLVTLLGLDFAGLLGGAVLTESIFAWPGIGQQAYQAIATLDVPMIMGTVLVSATGIIIVNAVVDGLYRWLDPRLRQP
ncbi:MAG: ABC transporter permease, partial [Candidatus Sericytochromatia bacterium]|nr:ABC transporter permease [Candidatus Sericytochromatia bacterium]